MAYWRGRWDCQRGSQRAPPVYTAPIDDDDDGDAGNHDGFYDDLADVINYDDFGHGDVGNHD